MFGQPKYRKKELKTLAAGFKIAIQDLASESYISVPPKDLEIIGKGIEQILSNNLQSIECKTWQLMIKLMDDAFELLGDVQEDLRRQGNSYDAGYMGSLWVTTKMAGDLLKGKFGSLYPGKPYHPEVVKTFTFEDVERIKAEMGIEGGDNSNVEEPVEADDTIDDFTETVEEASQERAAVVSNSNDTSHEESPKNSICLDIEVKDKTIDLRKRSGKELLEGSEQDFYKKSAAYKDNKERLRAYLSGEQKIVDLIANSLMSLSKCKKNKKLKPAKCNAYAELIYELYRGYKRAVEGGYVPVLLEENTTEWEELSGGVKHFVDNIKAVGESADDLDCWSELACIVAFMIEQIKYDSRKSGELFGSTLIREWHDEKYVKELIVALETLHNYIVNQYPVVSGGGQLSSKQYDIDYSTPRLFDESKRDRGALKPHNFEVFPPLLEKVKEKCPDYQKQIRDYGELPETTLLDDVVLYFAISKINEMRPSTQSKLFYIDDSEEYWKEHPDYYRLLRMVYWSDEEADLGPIRTVGSICSSISDMTYRFGSISPYELLAMLAITEWFVLEFESLGMSKIDNGELTQLNNAVLIMQKLLECFIELPNKEEI